MSNNTHLSSAAAARERTGLNHIGRLVELWLERYEQVETRNQLKSIANRVTRKRKAPLRQSPSSQSPSSQPSNRRPPAVMSSINPALPDRSNDQALPTAGIQGTFGFYQTADS